LADLGLPYPVLLFERFLGRPFASHRDSVSELVGEIVEAAVKDVLTAAKVSFRETKRAERITGFDQAPDFIIPDEFNPVALIEAKLTEDDGTARATRYRVSRDCGRFAIRLAMTTMGSPVLPAAGSKCGVRTCADCFRRPMAKFSH